MAQQVALLSQNSMLLVQSQAQVPGFTHFPQHLHMCPPWLPKWISNSKLNVCEHFCKVCKGATSQTVCIPTLCPVSENEWLKMTPNILYNFFFFQLLPVWGESRCLHIRLAQVLRSMPFLTQLYHFYWAATMWAWDPAAGQPRGLYQT